MPRRCCTRGPGCPSSQGGKGPPNKEASPAGPGLSSTSDPRFPKRRIPPVQAFTPVGTRIIKSHHPWYLYQAAPFLWGAPLLQWIWIPLSVQPLGSIPCVKRSCLPGYVGRFLEWFRCPLVQLGSQVLSFPMRNFQSCSIHPHPGFRFWSVLPCGNLVGRLSFHYLVFANFSVTHRQIFP